MAIIGMISKMIFKNINIICPYCAKQNSADRTICLYCGEALRFNNTFKD